VLSTKKGFLCSRNNYEILSRYNEQDRICPAPLKREEKTMTLYDELVARGLIAQVTDEEEIKNLIN